MSGCLAHILPVAIGYVYIVLTFAALWGTLSRMETRAKPATPPSAGPPAPSPLRLAGEGTELARLLREQREILDAVQGTALAGTAEVMAAAVGRMAEILEDLDSRPPQGKWMNKKRAALYLCYEHEDGTPNTGAFQAAADAAGLPRHYLTPRTPLYHQDEIDEFVWGR